MEPDGQLRITFNYTLVGPPILIIHTIAHKPAQTSLYNLDPHTNETQVNQEIDIVSIHKLDPCMG